MSGGHTAGPWGVESTSDTLWVGPLRPDGEKVDAVVVGLSYDRELTHAAKVRQQANARLIATAPDLLEALQNIVTRLGATKENDGHKDIWFDAFTAIARATGTDQ
ncbi:MAG: hypothetical protein ACRYGI_11520 [Janthinobacterium lividum]